jgi:hypothetical protein
MLGRVRRTYLLSPARLDGQRAQLVFREGASFELAQKLRTPGGAELGETFRFMSGLYFRGKLAYAQAFAARPADVLIITTNRGLLPESTRVRLDDLAAFARTDIDAGEPEFVEPLLRDVRALRGEVVLLGSIASTKYVETLLGVLGERLLFPVDFVGRGDMSRGGLLLRAADSREELTYAPVANAKRRGARPPKLAPRARA